MLVVSQGAGLVFITCVVVARGEGPPELNFLLWGVLSGVLGAGGIAAFYRALSIGVLGVVAPITATAAVVPVVVGLIAGERPSAAQGAGIALALVGVVLTALERGEGEGKRVATGVGMALIAALALGCIYVLLDVASEGDPYWAVLANRATSTPLLVAAALVLRPSMAVGGSRGGLVLVAIGALDTAANALFAVASTFGLVSLVAVLGSLYPVVTVALARIVLGERIRWIQRFGAVVALGGVVLISGGG